MHSRIVEHEGEQLTLTFGHEGVLYKRSFIMYDKQTNSKWNHSTGLAMVGPMAGTELNTHPSRLMQWENWVELHPKTRVLLGGSARGMMGTYLGDRSPSRLGVSIGLGPQPRLYPFDVLADKQVLNDTAGFKQVVVVMDPRSHQTFAFSRVVGDRVLTFEAVKDGEGRPVLMKDRETGTLWNRMTGQAVRGPMQGQELSPVVAVNWLRNRWNDIYPDGEVFGGSS